MLVSNHAIENNRNVSNRRDTRNVRATRWGNTRFLPSELMEYNDRPDHPEVQAWVKRCEAEAQAMADQGVLRYVASQLERCTKTLDPVTGLGRLHLQEYYVTEGQVSGERMNEYLSGSSNFLLNKKASQDAVQRRYCRNPEKEGFVQLAFEIGPWPLNSAQGDRVDWKFLNSAINAGEITTFEQANDLAPGLVRQNPTHIRDLIEAANLRRINESWIIEQAERNPFLPKVWQFWLRKYLLETNLEDRKIITVCDKEGCAGKSRFIEEFLRDHAEIAQDIIPGRLADMAEAIDVTRMRVLFIDITRAKNEFCNHVYDFCENLKSGKLFSPKFHSKMKRFPPPHIVIFTNDDIDLGGKPSGKSTWNGATKTYEEGVTPMPWTYDRYMWWDLTKNHLKTWQPGCRWYDQCPPFKGLTFMNMIQPYVPGHLKPVVTSGPEFNGDEAGDGPSNVNVERIRGGGIEDYFGRNAYGPIALPGGMATKNSPAGTWVDPNWPSPSYMRDRTAGAYWCMRDGMHKHSLNGDNPIIFWKYHRDGPWFMVTGHTEEALDESRRNKTKLPKVRRSGCEDAFDTSTWEASLPPLFEAKIERELEQYADAD